MPKNRVQKKGSFGKGVFSERSRILESQLFEELQSHPGLDDSHLQTLLTPTRFWPPLRPDFDLNLTQFWPQIAPRGQKWVKFRSESGQKGGQNRVGVRGGGLGVGSSGWSGSVAPSKICNSRDSRGFRDSGDSREPPDSGKQRRIRPFSRGYWEVRDFRDSGDSSSEKTPFVMTPFSGPERRLDDRGARQWKWLEEVLRSTSLTPLASPCFVLYLIGVETEGLLD